MFTLSGERIYFSICHNWSPFNIRSRSRNGWKQEEEGRCARAIHPIQEEDWLGLAEQYNRWALDKIYEELKERFKEAEKAHDSYVMDLEDAAEAEKKVRISSLTARFDKLELEVGEVIGSPLSGKSKFNPGAETTDITGLKSGSSRQDVHLLHQIPKPSDTGHTQCPGCLRSAAQNMEKRQLMN